MTHLPPTAICRLVLILLLVAVADTVPVAAAEDRSTTTAELEVQAAWNGLAGIGTTTELRIVLTAPVNGVVQLTVTEAGGGGLSRLHQFHISAGESISHALPIDVRSTGRFELSGQINGLPVGPWQVELNLTSAGLVATTLSEIDLLPRVPPSAGAVHLAYLSPDRLPGLATSYAMLDLLIIDAVTLEQLTADQHQALQQHLENCGRVIVRADEGASVDLQPLRGCDDTFAIAHDNLAAVQIAGRMMTLPPAERVSAEALRRLLPPTVMESELILAATITGYLLLMVLSIWKWHWTFAAFILPLAGSGAVWWFWSAGTTSVQSVTWSETRSDDARVVVRELGRTIGNGIEPTEILVPLRHLLRAELDGVDASFNHDTATMTLSLSPPLLGAAEYLLTGTATRSSGMQLTNSGIEPVVSNNGSAPSASARLGWTGRQYIVPELPEAATWRPGDQQPVPWSGKGADRLLRSLSLNAPVLLVNSSQSVSGKVPQKTSAPATGYLLVHP